VVASTDPTGPERIRGARFSFTHSLLRPALECLRRELLAMHHHRRTQASIGELDEDLDLLLADAADANMARMAPMNLRIWSRMVSHLKCTVAALIVPEKGIALVRGATDSKADGQLIARAHRQLLQIANANPHRHPQRHTQRPVANVIACRALVCRYAVAAAAAWAVLALLRDRWASSSALVTPRGRDSCAPCRGRGAGHYDA